MPMLSREEAALERSRAAVQRTHRPSERRDAADPGVARRSPYRAAAAAAAPVRAGLSVERAAGEASAEVVHRGIATRYETPYVMYDMFGPYTEVVTAGAGELSLSRNPDVKYLFNHRGMPMARTLVAETLTLTESDEGLHSVARVELGLPISQEVTLGIERGLLDEMSFAFVIVRGMWSPDWTEYRIEEYDIDRGDTSTVTYGANPYTEIEVERQAVEAVERTLTPAQRQSARRTLAGHLARN